MLIAPLSVPKTEPARPAKSAFVRAARMAPARPASTRWLTTWAIAGALIVLLVPAARGGGFFGATLPFWLVAAPLLDLAWIARRRIVRALRSIVADATRAPIRNVRRQRVPRAAACSSARS